MHFRRQDRSAARRHRWPGRSHLRNVDVVGAAAVSRHQADLTDPGSLAALRADVLAAQGRVDVIVNAVIDDGVIVHLGGFADGQLAFPFYSADAASRAGLRAFAEAANRELALAGRTAVVSFFSPSPAATGAERPFHPLWRSLGTAIVSPDTVASELVKAVNRREKVHIMARSTIRLTPGGRLPSSPSPATRRLWRRRAPTPGQADDWPGRVHPAHTRRHSLLDRRSPPDAQSAA
mgnify:CR=1 FL=1